MEEKCQKTLVMRLIWSRARSKCRGVAEVTSFVFAAHCYSAITDSPAVATAGSLIVGEMVVGFREPVKDESRHSPRSIEVAAVKERVPDSLMHGGDGHEEKS